MCYVEGGIDSMKKTVDIINAIFFHIHLGFTIIILLVYLSLYTPPFRFGNLLIFFAISIIIQLLTNVVLYALSSGFDEEVRFKKHNFSSLALYALVFSIWAFS